MFKRPVAFLLVSATLALPAAASTEQVRVTKVMDDKAIVTRSNGESYLIEPGVGCLSLWMFEGKSVLISSRGMFLGIGSRLLIPERDQECRIWDSELVDSAPPRYPVRNSPRASTGRTDRSRQSEEARALQKALHTLGYDPGPQDGAIGQKTQLAFDAFRASRGFDRSAKGYNGAIVALALEIVAKKPRDEGITQAATTLLQSAGLADTSNPPRPSPSIGSRCEDGHWVQSHTGDGSVVVLEDGTVWEISILDRIDTLLWLPTESIIVCGSRLINTDTGDSVEAVRIK